MLGMNMGIDLGTSHVRIYVPGRGVVLDEPTVIAVDSKTNAVIACGQEAAAMLGRTPDSIQAIQPLSKGVISEYDYAEQMLRIFVRRICAYKVIKPRASVSIAASVTEVEQRSIVEAVMAAGIRRVLLIEQTVAAAIGAGLPISQPNGSMVVDLGAGTCDVAVLSLKGMVTSLSLRVGGNDMDEAIVRYIRNRFNLVIGLPMAEQIKMQIGRAISQEENPAALVKGRHAVTGLPVTQEVCAQEIQEAIREPVREILAAVQRVLETTPPELAGDILSGGITLTGGGALLTGMVDAISRYTGVDCHMAEDPTTCVAIGTGRALKYAGVLSSGVYDISQFSYPMSDSSRLE